MTTLEERARDLAAKLGRAPGAKERVWFVLEAFEDDLWVTGESAPVLASVWGLHPGTVERSAATAALMLEDPANVDRARVEVTTRALQRSDVVFSRAETAEAREAGALYAAANQALETYGKATGAIAPAQTNIQVNAAWFAEKGQLSEEGRLAARREIQGVIHALVEDAVAKLPELEQEPERERLWGLAAQAKALPEGKR
jgi:hypothetical protein